jgi:hypothetical protein
VRNIGAKDGLVIHGKRQVVYAPTSLPLRERALLAQAFYEEFRYGAP